jgi:hypothetical protein
MRSFLLITAGLLALAAPAWGSFAPRLEVGIDPPTAGGPVAVSLLLTQSADEEATRSLHVALPGFASRPATFAACTGVAATSGTCPDDSRVGSAASTTSFGSFAGGVFFAGMDGERARLLAVLSNPLVPLVFDQRFTGTLALAAAGRELAFDDLPGPTATRLRIVLDRALLVAPSRCHAYDLTGRLTSHSGDRVERSTRVTIAGCPGDPPTILAPSLAPRAIGAGAASTLTFTLAEPASVRITARRTGSRGVRTLRRLAARPGRTRVGGLGRGLAPGRWLLTVRATDSDGASLRTLALRVVPAAGR